MFDRDAVELGLTTRQRDFVLAYLETGRRSEAVLRVYGCSRRDIARRLGHKLVHSAKVSAYLERILFRAGVPDKVVDAVAGALCATRPVTVDGRVTLTPDHAVRLRAVEKLFKILP
jgi:hypothetical protein